METLNGAINRFGLPKLIILSTLLLATAAFLFYMIDRVSKPDMSLLYGELDLADSGRIVSKLDSMGIPADIKGGGTQVYVPADEVGRLRMVLAEEGLPNGGSVGYEIFDRSEALGTTSFVQDINRLRALEGELARTIRTLSKVAAARVHLVLPKRELFNREAQEPRASIVLKIGMAGKLGSSQVAAIQQLVAAAVPGLKPSSISIIDDRGTLLARGEHEGTQAPPTDLDEARFEYERSLARSLEALIGRIVGPDKVRAEVTAEMDFDRLTENSEIFDPEGQVVRSLQTVEEGQNSSENVAATAAGAAANIPGAGEGGNDSASSKSKRNEETVNYEISKTLRTHIHESGGVKKISVALLVDGAYEANTEGAETYVPRSAEAIKNIEKLVKSAIGFDSKRGDQVEVVNMRFAPLEIPQGTMESGLILGLEKHQLVRLGEVTIVALFGLLILLLVVKPLLTRVLEGNPGNNNEKSAGNQTEGASINGAQGPADREPVAASGGPPQAASPGAALSHPASSSLTNQPNVNIQQVQAPQSSKLEEMVQLKSIQGDVHASSLKTIGNVIEQHPEEAVNVVRGWINEGSDA